MLSFKGRYFPKEINLMTVRWYFTYALNYRDIEELMREHSRHQCH